MRHELAQREEGKTKSQLFKHHDVVFWHLKRKQKVHFSPCFDTSHHAAVTNHLRQNIATIDLFYCSWCLFTTSTNENQTCRSLSLYHHRHTSQPQPRTAGTVYQYSIMTCFGRLNTTTQTINHSSQDKIHRSVPHLPSQRSTKTNPSTSYLALFLHGAKTTWSLSARTARYFKCKWLYQTTRLL